MQRNETATIAPCTSPGADRFGASPSDCAALLGPPEQVREKRALGRLLERRGGVEAADEGEVLVEIELREGGRVEREGLDLSGDPKALARLRAAHADATEQRQFLNFPALDVCLAGFGERKSPKRRLVLAYARSEAVYMTLLGGV